MKWLKVLSVSVILIVIVTGFLRAQAVTGDRQISSAEAAIEKALEFTGFGGIEGYMDTGSQEAELVTITNDSTPYVGRLINDRQIWQVNLADVPLLAIRPGGRPVDVTFEVLIDPDNGKLLKIHSRYVDTTYVHPHNQVPEVGPPLKIPKPDGDSATLFLIPSGPDPNEKDPLFDDSRFAGLPDAAPSALLDVMRNSPINTGKAIWIDAVYVLEKVRGKKEARPVWKLWLTGHPDETAESSRPPKEIRTYLQSRLITSDGALAECISVEVARWTTLSGDLPPGRRRMLEDVTRRGTEPSISGDDLSSLYIVTGPPGELLVTDRAGRKTGLDPIAGQEYQEIPRSSYSDRSMSDHDGNAMIRSSAYHTSLVPSGDYLLTVTGTDNGDYELGVYWYDITGEDSHCSFGGTLIFPKRIHNYTLSYDRLSAPQSAVTGGYDGTGEEPRDVNRLLSYVNIGSGETSLPHGSAGFDLFIIYGKSVIPETFAATLNGEDISGVFNPAAGKYEIVNVPLQQGRNVLVLDIGGTPSAQQVDDVDSLVFMVE